jgi:hypothetical protein
MASTPKRIRTSVEDSREAICGVVAREFGR